MLKSEQNSSSKILKTILFLVLGSGLKCRYPGWLAEHHTWQALNGRQQIHINSGVKSLKIRSDSSDLKVNNYQC